MKKSRSMRFASALLVCTLLSTCMISGTFAKYTTQDSGHDEARVAKWGVELQVLGNLYGDTYTDAIVKDTTDTGENIRVQSVDKAADVVAPGTKNEEGFTFSLTGKPEVDGVVSTIMNVQEVYLVDGTFGVMLPVDGGVVNEHNFDEFDALYKKTGTSYSLAEGWDASGEFYTLEDEVKLDKKYYPMVYSLLGNTIIQDTTEGETLRKAADAIKNRLSGTDDTKNTKTVNNVTTTYTLEKSFETNTDLATWKVDGLELNWNWAFGEEDKKGDSADITDKADTILGNLIAADPNAVKVVMANGNSYETIVINTVPASEDTGLAEYKYATVNGNTVACLTTQFTIDITVTQVD